MPSGVEVQVLSRALTLVRARVDNLIAHIIVELCTQVLSRAHTGSVSSVGRANGLHPLGRRFEPCTDHTR